MRVLFDHPIWIKININGDIMNKYIIDFDVFESAMHFAAKDDVRFYLRGVHLCSNRVEATNGHFAYMAKIDKPVKYAGVDGLASFPDIIFRPLNAIPSKTKNKWFSCVSISISESPRIDYIDIYGKVIATDVIEIIDGKFPNLAKLFSDSLKKESKGESFCVNANYINIFSKILKRERFPMVEFHPKSSNEAVMISFARPCSIGIKERVLIMPMRK